MAAGFGVAAVFGGGSASGAAGGTGWQWYKTDTHVHSVFSGDGDPDLGIISNSGIASGYAAFFLTDHHMGSSFPISIQTANNLSLDDNNARWTILSGSLGNGSPVKSGAVAWSLSNGSAIWTKRAANFRSGAVQLTFSVTKSLAAGMYVSASLGGDPSISPASGYTTSAGQVQPAASYVFVWYLGSPPATGGGNIIATSLAPFCSTSDPTWTTCTVPDMRSVLNQIPAAQRPLDYNAFTDVKIAANGGSGTIDAFAITAGSPVASKDEFAYRDTFLSNLRGVPGKWDTPAFRIYPGVENGIGDHVNRFDMGTAQIPSHAEYDNGTQGVPTTHAAGYPAQLDHVGLPGGVTDQEAISGVSQGKPAKLIAGSMQGVPAFGADVLEVRTDNMIGDWDAILTNGSVVLGTWATDNHLGTWSAGSQATYIQAPSIEFDDLMRSMYEGRMFLATNAFGTNRVVFNPDPAAADDYPSRYPIFVSPSQTTATAHLAITGGVQAGSSVVWITNGRKTLATDPAAGPSYDATKTVPLSGSPFTYVRAELRDGSGIQEAMTEPLIFRQLAGLPAGMSFHVDGVSTPDGKGYNNASTLGITSGAWDAAGRALKLTMNNPAGSLVEVDVSIAGQTPNRVTSGGAPVPRAAALADYLGATGPSWVVDAGVLHVKAAQGAGPTELLVGFAGTGDAVAPSAPAGLSATVAGPTRVDLSWSASTDNVGVAGYTVYREGVGIGDLAAGATSFSDSGAAAGTTYHYAVDAFDAAGNRSAQSNVVTATISGPAPPTTTTPPPTTPTTTTPTTTTPTTTTPSGGTKHNGGGTGPGTDATGPPVTGASLTQTLEGAFRAAASESHQENFDLRASVKVGKTSNEVARRLPRPVNLRIRGEAVVENAGRSRASALMSGLRGRVSLVGYDGKLYVSRDGKRFRQASPALRGLLPPAMPSGLGRSPLTLPAGLANVHDQGVKQIGGLATRHLVAQLTPAALRRFLTASLVRTGMSGAAAKAAAKGRVTANAVNLYILDNGGQLDRETVSVAVALGSGKGKTKSTAIASARADVSLSDFGADLSVAKPRSLGIVATLKALAGR
jgi:chitodextrinase